MRGRSTCAAFADGCTPDRTASEREAPAAMTDRRYVMGMQAVWYERTGPAREVLTLGELAIPEPVHGEVLIKVIASGVKRSLRRCWHCELSCST
jgi:hypothetical protein